MSSSSGESLRKLTKEILDTSRNAALIGGVKFLADKSGSHLLWWLYIALSGVLLAHVQSFVQADILGKSIRNRLGSRYNIAQILGVVISSALLFSIILLIDQAISAIAAAQLK